MNYVLEALAFIFDPANFGGPNGIAERFGEHLVYTVVSMLIALAIALPLGLYIGHTGRGRNAVIAITSAARAVPTFGLVLFVILFTGLGLWPLVFVLVVLAIPPVLAGVYSGLESVDRVTIDAARATGMSEWQILTRVEIPLGLPLIVGGVRAATLQVIATATIASYTGLGGLGQIITSGIGLNDYDRILGGALLVTALALGVDAVFASAQRLTATKGLTDTTRHATRRRTSSRSPRPPARENA